MEDNLSAKFISIYLFSLFNFMKAVWIYNLGYNWKAIRSPYVRFDAALGLGQRIPVADWPGVSGFMRGKTRFPGSGSHNACPAAYNLLPGVRGGKPQ